VIVDEAYARLMKEVILNKEKFGDTSELHSGFLKTQYQHEGITKFYIWEILQTQDRYYYGSLRWRDEDKVPELEEIRSFAKIEGNKIANQLSKGM
jgi:hypothetical protein